MVGNHEERHMSENKLRGPFEMTLDQVKVELEHIGEGMSGDFDPDNADDAPLLRFTVLQRIEVDHGDRVMSEWEQVDDASYCTLLRADTITSPQAVQAMSMVMNAVHGPLMGSMSIKKACERLSWMRVENGRVVA
jgi:hypothetical protein